MMVTSDNITKLSEDALHQCLDELYDEGMIKSSEYKLVDSELNRRSSIIIASNRRKKEAELAKQKELEKRIAEYESLRELSGERVTMKATVEEFGSEFESDYRIDDKFCLYSACFNCRNPNQQNLWQHNSLKEAIDHKFLLVYYRIYERYVRNNGSEINPETWFITRLKAAIAGILKGE